MAVSNGYAVLDGYPRETGGPDGCEAVVGYAGPTTSKYLFLKDVFGYVDTDTREWIAPKEYPNPLSNGMVAISFTARTFEGDSPKQLNGSAISGWSSTISSDCWTTIEVTFSNKVSGPGTVGGDGGAITLPNGTTLEIRRDGQIKLIEVPGRWMKYDTGSIESEGAGPNWDDTPNPNRLSEDHVFAFPYNSRSITMSWKNAPYPNFAHIESVLGKTNGEEWLGWPKFSVSLASYSTSFSRDILGTGIYTVDYEFVVETIVPSATHTSKYPDSVSNGLIGMIGRAYEPGESEMKLVAKENGGTAVPWVTADDLDALFEFEPAPP